MMRADGAGDRSRLVAGHFRSQALACGDLGSPLYAELLARVADDVDAGGPAAELLPGYAGDGHTDALALRLMGGVHRLVLDRRAPELAMYYPSVGGTADTSGAWPVLRAVLDERSADLRALLRQAPQTNEVGRASALVGGLHQLLAEVPGPIRLLEIGASAGLNLLADKFRIDAIDGTSVGPVDSPVVLANGWAGASLGAASVDIVERLGCDLAPLDPRTTEGRLRLTSYVWPDQLERIERLRGALALAAAHPVTVRQQGAADFLRDVQLETGRTTVLWHSVMWQYLPVEEQMAAAGHIERLGRAVTPDARFAHLSMEPDRPVDGRDYRFGVRLQTWPGGEERYLGTAAPHGLPTTWT